MIEKIAVISVLFILIVIILFSTTDFERSVVVHTNNSSKLPIEITPGKYKDRFCNMTIEKIEYSAQAVMSDNNTLFFDDVGCMVLWLNEQRSPDDIVLWVWAKDAKKYINAREAWYSLTDSTPMNYGFGAYKTKQGNYIDFGTMRVKMLRGETMANPKIRKVLLGND